MIPALLSTLQPLMQQSSESGERELYSRWSALMLVLILLIVIVLTVLAFIVAQRRARRRKESLPERKNEPIVDAWEESGRRMDDSFVEFSDED